MGKFLFQLARLNIMGTLVGFAFAYVPFFVPIKKTMQNKNTVSFKHPSPVYPDHILIIPRKIVRTVFCLSSKDIAEVMAMAVKIRKGDSRDFVLMINGGNRQDVMQAHFHLFTGNLVAKKGLSNKVDVDFLLSDMYIDLKLRDILRQQGISKKSFSMIIQFAEGAHPSMYFM